MADWLVVAVPVGYTALYCWYAVERANAQVRWRRKQRLAELQEWYDQTYGVDA